MKVISVFLGIVAFVTAIPWVPEPKQEQWWLDRHYAQVNNTLYNPNPSSIKVLFYGDSITEGWGGEGSAVFAQYYAPVGTANYGVGADSTENLLWRIKNGQLQRLDPTLCVVKIGTNNLANDDDTSIAMGVVFNVLELRERLPNMKILLLGILPRYNEAWTNRIDNVNSIISRLDNGNTIRYLNMRNHFYKGGDDFYTELYSDDILHLSAAGYQKWAEVMDPLFREMLGSKNEWPLNFLKA